MRLQFKNSTVNYIKTLCLGSALLLLVLFVFQGCERDDICSEDTQKTPLLRISFVNDEDGNEKQVPLLQVGFEGAKTEDDDDDPDTPPVPILLPTEGAANATEILLPLDTQNNSTTFYFIQNSGQEDEDGNSTENIDTVQVIYSRKYDYISRACGYKVTFEALSESQATFVDDDEWIKLVFVENSTIENSEEAHIIIRH